MSEVVTEEVNGEAVSTDINTNDNTETITETNEVVKAKEELMIPKERFDDVNGKYKTLVDSSEEVQKENKRLQDELDGLKSNATSTKKEVTEASAKLAASESQYTTLLEATYEEKAKVIPEEMKDLIPEGLTMEDKISWINKAQEKGIFSQEKPKVVIGQALNHSAEQSTAESQKKMNPIQLLSSYYGVKK